MFIEINHFQFSRGLCKEQTNTHQEILFLLISLCALLVIERMKDRMKDTVWEQVMKDKSFCARGYLPMWDVSAGLM